jgi:hypothetical protein
VALRDRRFDSVQTTESCEQSEVYATSASQKSALSRIRQASIES